MIATADIAQEQDLWMWLPHLIQVSDPLFPTGGYAHSLGLEEWAATCNYRDKQDLVTFFEEHVACSLTRLELPYLHFIIQLLGKEQIDWQQIKRLDSEINAWKWASEIREASLAQGRGRLRLLKKLWTNEVIMQDYTEQAKELGLHGHHLLITAIQFKILGVPLRAGLLAYGYQSFANFSSASIKLLRMSPESVQGALLHGLSLLPEIVDKALVVEHNEAGYFMPHFDIACARHSTAFSRLFIS